MRKIYLIKIFFSTMVLIASGYFSNAQCPAGASTATLNWENMDYLTQIGNYAGFVTTPMMQTQKFTMGRNRVTINFPATIATAGENELNTAEAGSYGTQTDVEYSGNGTITITFDTVVYNLQFSLYDVDALQTVRINAFGPALNPLNVTMTSISAGVLTIAGSGGTAPTATANATTILNNDLRGTVNISIAGNTPLPATGIKSLTITTGGTAGNFWLSDLNACVFGSFPLNYFASQKPWVGQPAYYLVTPDNNSVYLLDPLTGIAQWLFSEPASPWVNSMAYDHVNHVLYYVMDNASPVLTNKSLKKYDFNTETISTVIPDLTAFGIPLFNMVVESAGAAFYNGSLFLGIEGTNAAKTSRRESIIWRIDFDAANLPVQASQAYALPTDNGTGTLTHDWGDFTIKDGVLYDFNTGNSGVWAQFIHYDLQTGDTTVFNTNGSPAPIQAGQTWDGKIYWTGGQGSEPGYVAPYLENGKIGTKILTTVTKCSPPWVGRAGDASDPFRPKSDFGDAPDSYDPNPVDKATHEFDCNLRLGATYDREWDKTSSATATADGTDEDAISTVTILPSGISNFIQDVKVYNNTGANATLAAWLDFNNNGLFDPVEGKILTIPTNAAMQTVTISWFSIPVSLPPGSKTFLRLRLTSASNGMTVNNSTRWFANGEVEDWMVNVDIILPVNLLSFMAQADGAERVAINWNSGREANLRGYEIEKSDDNINWNKVDFVEAYADGNSVNRYRSFDNKPVTGRNYYRLKMLNMDESFTYSETRIVEFKNQNGWIKLSPNPASDHALLQFGMEKSGNVQIQLIASSGSVVINKNISAVKGNNQIDLNEISKLLPGVYMVKLVTADGILTNRLVKQ